MNDRNRRPAHHHLKEITMYSPIDPESHLRNVAADTRRTLETNRRIAAANDRGKGPRRVRFRHQ